MERADVPPPSVQDPMALGRPLDPAARAVLLEDTPNYWTADQPALANLAFSPVIDFSEFDALAEENKYVISARVAHLVDELSRKYSRHLGTEGPDVYQLRLGHVTDVRDGQIVKVPYVFYTRTEDQWQRLVELADRPGVTQGSLDPAAAQLETFLGDSLESGDLVHGERLEALLGHAQTYLEPVEVAANRLPNLDMEHLDRDLVHAFLCAYAACFHA